MEKEPTIELELSIEEQIDLAFKLSQAVDARNTFTERRGGFDTFAEAGQYVGNAREMYDKLSGEVVRLRQEVDKRVRDKKSLVQELRQKNEEELADRISRMFDVE